MFSRLHRCAFLFLLAVAVALVAAPAMAVEMGPGTKNFTAPRNVPNYFSNEAEPFLGRGSPETGYERPFVRGGVSHHYARYRGGRYRGRTAALRGRRPAGGHFASGGRRIAGRAVTRPVGRGRTATPGLRHLAASHAGRPARTVHAVRDVRAIHAVADGHRIRAVHAVAFGSGVRGVHGVHAVHAGRAAPSVRVAHAVRAGPGRAVAPHRTIPVKRPG
jgi:hypothetical protein